jgi:Na+/glutamate symporter
MTCTRSALVVLFLFVSADVLLRNREDEVKSDGMTGKALGSTAAQLTQIEQQLQARIQFSVIYMFYFN